jgi:glycerol-3-phosphate acyltransferase PlsX
LRIGVDLLGSDSPPHILFDAILLAAQQLPSFCTFIVFADVLAIQQLTTKNLPLNSRINFHLVSDLIEMEDDPLPAIRQKKKSSIVIGMRLLKKQHLDAYVTAGNTGALIASATLSLPKLPDIKRPALLATLPTKKNDVTVIDVGGNVHCKAHHLVQFAKMGAAFHRCTAGTERSRVGLLNIGAELKKGSLELRQAHHLLADKPIEGIQFIGNVEGRQIFEGDVDVLVTDGFTGNIVLKTAEGISSFIFDHLKGHGDHFQRSIEEIQHQFNYAEYPGALLCGVEGIVIKCHGHSSVRAFYNGILGAANLVQKGFLDQIKAQLL